MRNRERTENLFFKILEEAPEEAIAALCIVLSTEEAERILREERTTMLNGIYSLIGWMSNQPECNAIKLRPKLAELTEVINRIISER